jgi:O-antigen ligase
VFSFYSDAGQFGASQAHIALIALILALGPFKLWKRTLLAAAALMLIVGMFISGTRGAMFALGAGIMVALLISKNIKVFVLGSALALGGFLVLKYTTIGSSNYNIYRMRTALDPTDPSLNVRFKNQQRLATYLADHPLGGGLGVIGNSGIKYNSDKYLSTIPPDSYWVKVWAMYGIVGFVIWLGLMLYILGKCCGIVWNIQDRRLKAKLIALTAGFAGSLFSSYGNEVINFMPSALVVFVSWAFVFRGPQLDKQLASSP